MIAYFINGLRRSGNHLFINIIINNYDRVLFFNDIFIDTQILIPHLIENDSEVIGNSKIASKLVNNLNQKPECIIFSFEDFSLENFEVMITKINKRFTFKKVFKCIVLRDLLNCLASRIAANNEIITPVNETIIDLWYTHFNSSFIKLNYNLFLQKEEYKKILSKLLDLNFIEDIDTVSLFFSGSSFKRNSTVKQDNINYLTRYKLLLSEDKYKLLLSEDKYKLFLSEDKLLIENYFNIKYQDLITYR